MQSAIRSFNSCGQITKYRLAIAVLWGIGLTALSCLLMNLNGPIGLLLFPSGLLAFAVPFLLFRKAGLTELKRIAGWSVPLVITLAALACFPSMNPLWPHGMTELARQESDLQAAIQLGMSLDQVRDVLNSRKIQVYEFNKPSDGIVLENPQTTITAQSGDTVLVSRFETGAFEFPCSYDMQIVLLFGQSRKLKERYIHRFRLCP